MRTSITMLVLALATASASADPQTSLTASRPDTLGVDGDLALPVGTYGDAAGLGFGVIGRVEHPVASTPELTITGRVGFVYHLSKDMMSPLGGTAGSLTVMEFPILGGVRYDFSRSASGSLYGAAEAGLVVLRASASYNGVDASDSQTNLGMTLGGGYRTGKLDLRGQLFFADLGHAGDSMSIMATIGYDLTTL